MLPEAPREPRLLRERPIGIHGDEVLRVRLLAEQALLRLRPARPRVVVQNHHERHRLLPVIAWRQMEQIRAVPPLVAELLDQVFARALIARRCRARPTSRGHAYDDGQCDERRPAHLSPPFCPPSVL